MTTPFSFCTPLPSMENSLTAGEGFGIEMGMGLMGLGLVEGMLKGLDATHMESCVTEAKDILCNLETALDEGFKNHDIGKMFSELFSAYMKVNTTKTDCLADYKVDGPMLKEWAAQFTAPGFESKIMKNVLRHSFKFLIQFNEAKKTWD